MFLVGTTWAGESAALVIGSAVGRHPLAPVISPRKTVEGAVGQLVVSVAAAGVLGVWLLPQWSAGLAMLVGAVLGVTGQIGDLAESVIKRSLGTKDTGGLVPGHGGVLDRLDGLLVEEAHLSGLRGEGAEEQAVNAVAHPVCECKTQPLSG